MWCIPSCYSMIANYPHARPPNQILAAPSIESNDNPTLFPLMAYGVHQAHLHVFHHTLLRWLRAASQPHACHASWLVLPERMDGQGGEGTGDVCEVVCYPPWSSSVLLFFLSNLEDSGLSKLPTVLALKGRPVTCFETYGQILLSFACLPPPTSILPRYTRLLRLKVWRVSALFL